MGATRHGRGERERGDRHAHRQGERHQGGGDRGGDHQHGRGPALQQLTVVSILAGLLPYTDRPVYVQGAVEPLVQIYREQGVAMLPTRLVSESERQDFAGELILAPPSAAGSPWMKRFKNASTGFCSGWMRIRGNRRRRGYDRGFVLSDHADWPALIQTIREVNPRQVLPTHGNTDGLVRYLQEQGIQARSLETAFGDEED